MYQQFLTFLIFRFLGCLYLKHFSLGNSSLLHFALPVLCTSSLPANSSDHTEDEWQLQDRVESHCEVTQVGSLIHVNRPEEVVDKELSGLKCSGSCIQSPWYLCWCCEPMVPHPCCDSSLSRQLLLLFPNRKIQTIIWSVFSSWIRFSLWTPGKLEQMEH